MKRIIFCLAVITSITCVKAQDVNRTFGIGLQASFPTYGISLKYGITDNSVVQAAIAPFGASSDGESVSLNFYGARYVYRFPGDDASTTILDPYLFAGAGIMTYKTNFSNYGIQKTSDSFFSYSAGGGLELIVGRKLGISGEIGYGKLNVSGGVGVNAVLAGTGIHIYIR